jgi:hypothetical protein
MSLEPERTACVAVEEGVACVAREEEQGGDVRAVIRAAGFTSSMVTLTSAVATTMMGAAVSTPAKESTREANFLLTTVEDQHISPNISMKYSNISYGVSNHDVDSKTYSTKYVREYQTTCRV